MTFQRPNIGDISERVKGDLRSGLDLKAILRRSLAYAIGKAITGVSHELHGRLSWAAKQMFVDKMEVEYLDRYGAIYEFTRKPATYAKLNIKFTGTAGTSIPAGTEITRADGLTYTTDDILTIQTASAAVAEVTDITTVADIAGSLNNKYFYIYSPNADYYVWFNVSGSGTDPEIADKVGVEVPIVTNESAATVANKVRNVINNLADFSATFALNVVTVTCDDTGSVTNPADVNTGFSFSVTTEGVSAIIGDEVTGVVTASEAGSVYNTDANDLMTLSSAIPNVDSEVTVVSTDTEGEDVEGDEAYRARLLDFLREPPHGGNANDYIQWALQVPGVTRAWVLPDQMGAGTVLLWFVEDGEVNIFPDQAKIDEVYAYIADNERKPITATLYVASPSPVDLDITVKIKPYNQTVIDAITAELQDLIYRDAVPHGALKDAGTGEQYDGKILISHIREAISIAHGEFDHELVLPTTNAPATTGQMYRLGTVIFEALE